MPRVPFTPFDEFALQRNNENMGYIPLKYVPTESQETAKSLEDSIQELKNTGRDIDIGRILDDIPDDYDDSEPSKYEKQDPRQVSPPNMSSVTNQGFNMAVSGYYSPLNGRTYTVSTEEFLRVLQPQPFPKPPELIKIKEGFYPIQVIANLLKKFDSWISKLIKKDSK